MAACTFDAPSIDLTRLTLKSLCDLTSIPNGIAHLGSLVCYQFTERDLKLINLARDEFHHLSESVCRLQGELAETKKELQQEQDNARSRTSELEQTVKNVMGQVEEMRKELANALHAVQAAEMRSAAAETRAADAETRADAAETRADAAEGERAQTKTVFQQETDNVRSKCEQTIRNAKRQVEEMENAVSAAETRAAVIEGEWAQAKTVFQQEWDNVRSECEQTIRNAKRQVEEMGNAVSAAKRRAAVGEMELQDKFEMELKKHADDAASKVAEQNVQLNACLADLDKRNVDRIEKTKLELKKKFEMELKKHTDQVEEKAAAAEGCAICWRNRKELVFNCGHMSCEVCKSKLENSSMANSRTANSRTANCPFCRTPITSCVRLFTG